MIRSHDIAMQLVAEHQRDLRASSAPRWRFSRLFGRRSAQLEPVGPAAASAAGDGPGLALPAAAPVGARLDDSVATASVAPARAPARPRPGLPLRGPALRIGEVRATRIARQSRAPERSGR